MIRKVGASLRAGPLDRATTAAVGFLFTADYNRRATCFLVADWWIATASHVFDREQSAANWVALFNFVAGGKPDERDGYAMAPERGLLVLGPGLDCVLVRLHARPHAVPPGRRWGRVALAGARRPLAGEPVVHVQHPDDASIKAYSRGHVVRPGAAAATFEHDAEAREGSSGAPLFDSAGHWLGIHKGTLASRWKAVRADLVLAAIRARRLPPDLREALRT